MSSDNPPRLVHSAVMGAIATSFLSGPTFSLIASVDHLLSVGDVPNMGSLVTGFVITFIFSTIIGLLGAIPAAIVNATLLLLLAQEDFDGRAPAILSGALCGVLIAPGGLRLFISKEGAGYWGSGDNVVKYVLCLAATGALMGLVHWLIAIRPYRRWRLDGERDIEARVE